MSGGEGGQNQNNMIDMVVTANDQDGAGDATPRSSRARSTTRTRVKARTASGTCSVVAEKAFASKPSLRADRSSRRPERSRDINSSRERGCERRGRGGRGGTRTASTNKKARDRERKRDDRGRCSRSQRIAADRERREKDEERREKDRLLTSKDAAIGAALERRIVRLESDKNAEIDRLKKQLAVVEQGEAAGEPVRPPVRGEDQDHLLQDAAQPQQQQERCNVVFDPRAEAERLRGQTQVLKLDMDRLRGDLKWERKERLDLEEELTQKAHELAKEKTKCKQAKKEGEEAKRNMREVERFLLELLCSIRGADAVKGTLKDICEEAERADRDGVSTGSGGLSSPRSCSALLSPSASNHRQQEHKQRSAKTLEEAGANGSPCGRDDAEVATTSPVHNGVDSKKVKALLTFGKNNRAVGGAGGEGKKMDEHEQPLHEHREGFFSKTVLSTTSKTITTSTIDDRSNPRAKAFADRIRRSSVSCAPEQEDHDVDVTDTKATGSRKRTSPSASMPRRRSKGNAAATVEARKVGLGGGAGRAGGRRRSSRRSPSRTPSSRSRRRKRSRSRARAAAGPRSRGRNRGYGYYLPRAGGGGRSVTVFKVPGGGGGGGTSSSSSAAGPRVAAVNQKVVVSNEAASEQEKQTGGNILLGADDVLTKAGEEAATSGGRGGGVVVVEKTGTAMGTAQLEGICQGKALRDRILGFGTTETEEHTAPLPADDAEAHAAVANS